MGLIKKIKFDFKGDKRGTLVAVEDLNLPFQIKRVYYIFNTHKNQSRGHHAHKKLKQVAICINGSCSMDLDDGSQEAHVTLNSPNEGLLIDNLIWKKMYDFSDDCILLLIASDIYDESDYISNYKEFKEFICEKK
jgi:dTDP-4-dehydrorhamnose 3,5-epimerase-like enzyme